MSESTLCPNIPQQNQLDVFNATLLLMLTHIVAAPLMGTTTVEPVNASANYWQALHQMPLPNWQALWHHPLVPTTFDCQFLFCCTNMCTSGCCLD
jgi:hypothetical protein